MKQRWNSLTERGKLIVSLVSILLLISIAYTLNLKEVILLYKEVVRLESDREELLLKLDEFNSAEIEGNELASCHSLAQAQTLLLNAIDEYSSGIEFNSMMRPIIEVRNGKKMVNLSFLVDGGFKSQLRLIRKLELNLQGHYLQAVEMKIVEQKVVSERRLRATFYYKALIV